MYYLTVYNEPFQQPAEPENLDVQGLLAGMYKLADGPQLENAQKAQILASGVAVPWALRAQELLAQDWGVSADVWSVTSWTELRRDAVDVERHNLLRVGSEPRVPYVTSALSGVSGPVVAVSDWMRAVPDLIRPYVPTDMVTLGTDGFGLSDTRPAARRHFLVDAESITVAALVALARRGEVPTDAPAEAAARYHLDDPTAAGPQTTDPGDA
jgi:pyruvate dehydrogenase E1 component